MSEDKEEMPKLTVEMVQELAKMEREMDSGERPFVILDGNRMCTDKEALEKYKLTTGQIINTLIFREMMLDMMMKCEKELVKQMSPKDFKEEK